MHLDPDPIFIRDGNVWTSAGVTAGIDLALAFVEADLGRRVALAVARQLVVFLKRPGGQAQFSATLKLQHGDERFDRLHAWILDNLRGDLSLAALAERANMSPRSFSRHYRKTTGRTPARAIEEIRTEAARRLLEQGLSVSQASRRCGFGSEETMRRGFLRTARHQPASLSRAFLTCCCGTLHPMGHHRPRWVVHCAPPCVAPHAEMIRPEPTGQLPSAGFGDTAYP